jgi:hypothetical protein
MTTTPLVWNVSKNNDVWTATLSEKVHGVHWSIDVFEGIGNFDTFDKSMGFTHSCALVVLYRIDPMSEDTLCGHYHNAVVNWLLLLEPYRTIDTENDLTDCLSMASSLVVQNIGGGDAEKGPGAPKVRWVNR